MAYTTINKSTDYFNTVLYTGNGSYGKAVTGVGFQPDFIWIKNRSATLSHRLSDAVRGTDKALSSDNNSAELSSVNLVHSFDSDGFTVDDDGAMNGNGNNIVAWNWKANGQGSSNTDGSINTTYTSVNTTAGFSISTYTGTGSNATVGHGLGVAPKMILIKRLSAGDNWIVYHNSLGGTKNLYLDATNAQDTRSDTFNNTAPTSSVFSLGSATGTNGSGQTYVAYCFAEKTGYSKFGSYTGNGNADGTFVYTGFKPSFVIIKNSSNAHNWTMIDNKRLGYNDKNYILFPDLTNAEPTTSETDILSNGFKIRASANGVNQSGNTMIYMAFGQSLVGSNNVPCTAR